MKKDKAWIKNKNDLANKSWFNIIFWGFGLLNVIVGSKHLAYFGTNWKGMLVSITGFIMLFYQLAWLLQKIDYYEGRK